VSGKCARMVNKKEEPGGNIQRCYRTQKNVSQGYAVGAYSFKQGFDAIAQSGGIPSIPIRSGTTVKKDPSAGEMLRNKLLEEIWGTWRKNCVEKTVRPSSALMG